MVGNHAVGCPPLPYGIAGLLPGGLTMRPNPLEPPSRGGGLSWNRRMSAVDIFALAIIAAAILRGRLIGLLGEAISLSAVGAGVVAMRVWDKPLANWLQSPSGWSVRYDLAPWLAGVILFTAALIAVATFGRVMRDGATRAGLSRLDRLGGAVLGIAEGVVVAGLLVFAMGGWLGRDHESLAGSAALALVELTNRPDEAPADWVSVDVTAATLDRSTPAVALGAEPRPAPRAARAAERGPGASGFLVIFTTLGGIALFALNRWTSEVVVHTITDLPKGVRPSQVQWISSSDPGDRVRVGPLLKQEWHLVDKARSTHLVLAWKGRD